MTTELVNIQPLYQPVKLSGEMAVFSPEVEAEIDWHLAKYPSKRSAILPHHVHRAARARLSGCARRFVPGESSQPAHHGHLGSRDVLFDAAHEADRPIPHSGLQDAFVQAARRGQDHRTVFEKLGIKPGETTADGKFSLSLVECLGSCGTAPMFQVNFDYHENLTTEKVDQILDSLP